ncbi:MAG: hypothetical protein NVS4B2_17980 [Chloroflexota bacterium]
MSSRALKLAGAAHHTPIVCHRYATMRWRPAPALGARYAGHTQPPSDAVWRLPNLDSRVGSGHHMLCFSCLLYPTITDIF